MTLSFKLHIDIMKAYMQTKYKVLTSKYSKVTLWTDRQIDSQKYHLSKFTGNYFHVFLGKGGYIMDVVLHKSFRSTSQCYLLQELKCYYAIEIFIQVVLIAFYYQHFVLF